MRFPRALRLTIATAAAASLAPLSAAMAASGPAPSVQPRSTWYGLPTSMTLTVPPVYAGVPVTFTATLNNTVVDGSISFWANGPQYGLAPSIPVSNGKASLTWMPGATGSANWITFGASFTPNPQQGTTDAWATVAPMIVLPNRGADPITLTPSASTVVTGGTVTVTSTTGSGSTPTLTARGPCTLGAASVVTGTGIGTCVITGTTFGGGAYLAGVGTTSITVAAPPKAPAKPKPKPKPKR